MEEQTITRWSQDRKSVTFCRQGIQSRVERFVNRVRSTLPVLRAKFPADLTGVDALAEAGWLSREEYSGPLRDQGFRLIANEHFVQDLSSGTTGEPVLRYHVWSDECSEQLMTTRCFKLAGVGPKDRCVFLEIGAAEVGTFYFRSFSELGVRDMSFVHVTTDFLGSIEPLEELDPTVILTVPSILARCGPRFFDLYDGKRERALRAMIHYSEPLSPTLRQRLLDIGVESFSFYGTTELGGAASECREHDGLHVMDDWILPSLREVVEVAPGRYRGELGWTAMHYKAMPMVKYAVGDVVEIDTNPCPCGAPGVRMKFASRTYDVVAVYGLKFPFKPIETALAKAVGEEDPLLQLIVDDVPKGIRLTVRVCRDYEIDKERIIDALYKVFEIDEMLDMGFLEVSVEPVDRSSFSTRKLRRVIDRRTDAPFEAEEGKTSDPTP